MFESADRLKLIKISPVNHAVVSAITLNITTRSYNDARCNVPFAYPIPLSYEGAGFVGSVTHGGVH